MAQKVSACLPMDSIVVFKARKGVLIIALPPTIAEERRDLSIVKSKMMPSNPILNTQPR